MTVLVCDSNPTVRKILRRNFDALGWATVEAENADELLEKAGEDPRPNAIVMDLNLRGVSGLDLCRQLKADDELQTIPVIAMLSDSQAEAGTAMEAGADELLAKPINRAELTVRLRSLARIHRFNQEMIGAESVAMALARAVSSKDGYSSGHVEEVANLAAEFAGALGLATTELKAIRYGAILHNVGKIAIPDSVLEKTDALTPRERALFQQHPRVGCDICSPLAPLKRVLPIIRHHKEHWDGTGFPDGLKGDDIPIGAQIVGLVDVYSAMTNDRPFRKALPHEEAVRHLARQAERQVFNPKLTRQFIDFLNDRLEKRHEQALANHVADEDDLSHSEPSESAEEVHAS